jgi:DNA-binding transcriptional LysR family regulator
MKNSMLLPVSLQDIQYFLAIVQFNTLIKAADYLNVTQPLLSKRMRFLQDTIGITLFKHSNRNIVLTPAGKLLYKEWGQIERLPKNIVYLANLPAIAYCFS